MKIYGRNMDGTLTPCKAKPENRGKGRCYHQEHVELTINNKELLAMNEAALERYLGATPPIINKNNLPYVTEERFQTHPSNRVLNKAEFKTATTQIATVLPENDWQMISAFYRNIEDNVTDNEEAIFTESVNNIVEYLNSDDPVAVKVRDFLGPEIDSETFATLLVHNVNSMVASLQWKNGTRSASVSRAVLTALNNDMTKERYVASVLFFGGRCCYCNCVLRKSSKGKRLGSDATGEHITPIRPENPDDIVGGTRYGNMVLACHDCNTERRNEDLKEWMTRTGRITPENKVASLQRIEFFRRYALYSEYSVEESKKITDRIREIEEFKASLPRVDDRHYSDEDAQRITERIKIAVYDLSEELRL